MKTIAVLVNEQAAARLLHHFDPFNAHGEADGGCSTGHGRLRRRAADAR